MSRGRRPKKRKGRKRLAYVGITVAFILIFLTYFLLHQSNQTPSPKAAIVDHLSFTGQPNQTFVDECINIFEGGGLTWAYHKGEEVTVNFYRNLPSYATSLIILRVHSAILEGTTTLGLFTSELYSDEAARKYRDDVLNNRLVWAFFTEGGPKYFGIAPEFIEESMKGNFENTIIIMMGCDGLKYDTIAEAFRKKGAKVCIGWDGLVSTPHTDRATACLLQYLAQRYTIKRAVNETMNKVGPEKSYFQIQVYNSTLKYYPEDAGNYAISYTVGSSSMDTLRAGTVLVKEEKKGIRLNWLQQVPLFSAKFL